MSSSSVSLEEYMIPLEEIVLATHNFSSETEIGRGGFGVTYKGHLSERWKNRIAAFKRFHPYKGFRGPEFSNAVEMMSSLNHENIIPFIGYCSEANEMIIVSEYASNHSLEEHLRNPDKRRALTWTQRLKICLRAAAGLDYLHSGLGEGRLIIHRDIKSSKFLLDDNLEAKLTGFNMSILVELNQPPVNHPLAGTHMYMDPLYKGGGDLKIESDVYSFGVVMFEVLSGMLAHELKSFNNELQTLLSLARRYYDDGPDSLIDPHIRDHIDIRSFRAFTKTAYQCISWNINDRPRMSVIINKIQEALDIQNREVGSTITLPSQQDKNLESLLIPLKEIQLATRSFHSQIRLGYGEARNVYRGQLSEQWQNRIVAVKKLRQGLENSQDEFSKELKMVPSFHHENVIGYIGYCNEDNEMILVYEYTMNGTLNQHLHDPEFNKTSYLTWAQRLQICIGAARGLEYLHSGLGENYSVIHRNIDSKYILLGDNLEAKISNFSLSLIVDNNQPQPYGIPPRNSHYTDPIYDESGLINTNSDIYSFGVLMLETLSGTPAYKRRSIGDDQPKTLIHLVRHYFHDGLDILIDPHICDQVDIHSFRAFMKIVYRCVSLTLENRPTMKKIVKQLQEAWDIQNREAASPIITRSRQHQNIEDFRISLKDIKCAIKDFSQETPIGDGGYGKVYKAQLSETTVAIKCLDPEGHQGRKEFSNEVNLISIFHHPNIIPFIGYCDEEDQMIIISKYALNGSLDDHLRDHSKRNHLTWAQRLKICLGAAKGLDYLHWGLGKDKWVIHRDVKSANILLDENMEAKICDFGLSKQASKNQKDTKVYTKISGTNFYMDPLYREGNVLSKESDVYSFGVVLFEVLSGMLAYGPQPLISLVRRYHKNQPHKLIDPVIRYEIDTRSFNTFKELALKCISLNSGERPTMDRIIDRIEDALDFQEHVEV